MGMYFVESVINFGGYVEADSKAEAEEKGYYYDNLEYVSVDSVEVTEDGLKNLVRYWIDKHKGWGKFEVSDYLSDESITWSSIWKNGESTVDNLALACQGCNNYKHTKTQAIDSITSQVTDLYHPRQQQWQDHFTWKDDYSEIIGLTPTGRVTVELLKLNRQGVVNLRRILYATGNHPPS
jgi:hypothetical protein